MVAIAQRLMSERRHLPSLRRTGARSERIQLPSLGSIAKALAMTLLLAMPSLSHAQEIDLAKVFPDLASAAQKQRAAMVNVRSAVAARLKANEDLAEFRSSSADPERLQVLESIFAEKDVAVTAALRDFKTVQDAYDKVAAETPASRDVVLGSPSVPASIPVMQYTGPGGLKAAASIAVGVGYSIGWGRVRQVRATNIVTSNTLDNSAKAQYDANWWFGGGIQYAYTANSGGSDSRALFALWGGRQGVGLTAGVAPGSPWIWVFGVITKADFFEWVAIFDANKK